MPSDPTTSFPDACWLDGVPGRVSVGVVVGMESEAALLPPGSVVGVAGADSARAADQARRLIAQGAQALLSFGIAGGLDPALRPGDVIVARAVIEGGRRYDTNPVWMCRLRNAMPQCHGGEIVSSAAVVAGRAGKRALFAATGAAAVDMESGAVARVAAEAGCPFAVIRAVADPADLSLPSAALAGIGPDGRSRPLAVLARLARRPWQIVALARLGIDSRTAHAALGGVLPALGPGFTL